MRNHIDKESLEKICERFLMVSEGCLGLNMKTLAERLGYTNQSTLTKVRRKEGFIGPDKLKQFGELINDQGQHPNIHYIITGEEPVFFDKTVEEHNDIEIDLLVSRLVKKLGKNKAKELLELII